MRCAPATPARLRRRCSAVLGGGVWPLVEYARPRKEVVSGIERALLYKAQVVAPRIHNVERALAPGPPEDIGSRLTVDRVGSQSVELSGALVDGVDIAYGEVERLRARAGRYSALGRIDDGDDEGPLSAAPR